MPSITLLTVAILLQTSVFTQEPTRLVAASNVRLRAAPSDTAAVVVTVPLGLPLIELETGGDGGTWVRMRLPDGIGGWTPSRLTRRMTPENTWEVIESLARERLARRGDSFPARVELVAFLERVRPEALDPEISGRLALHWITAMSRALAAIPQSQARAEPYATWLKARPSIVVYNEPGGRWMLRREVLLDLHRREADTGSADAIAWFMASAGLPGECERFVPCHVRRANDLDGEYLRRHSAGAHTADAVQRIAERATSLSGAPYFYEAGRDCAELLVSLTPLRAAIAATRVERRREALDALDRLSLPCGKTR